MNKSCEECIVRMYVKASSQIGKTQVNKIVRVNLSSPKRKKTEKK